MPGSTNCFPCCLCTGFPFSRNCQPDFKASTFTFILTYTVLTTAHSVSSSWSPFTLLTCAKTLNEFFLKNTGIRHARSGETRTPAQGPCPNLSSLLILRLHRAEIPTCLQKPSKRQKDIRHVGDNERFAQEAIFCSQTVIKLNLSFSACLARLLASNPEIALPDLPHNVVEVRKHQHLNHHIGLRLCTQPQAERVVFKRFCTNHHVCFVTHAKHLARNWI